MAKKAKRVRLTPAQKINNLIDRSVMDHHLQMQFLEELERSAPHLRLAAELARAHGHEHHAKFFESRATLIDHWVKEYNERPSVKEAMNIPF